MWTMIKRLFTIKTKFEAFLIIYALALGATERGIVYFQQYPGSGGKLLALACTGAVFMAGRSEEHTSELQSLMRTSYAVSWLKKKIYNTPINAHQSLNIKLLNCIC